VSNLPGSRIILNRNICRKWENGQVPEKLEQQSWAGFAQGDADVWRDFIDREIPRLYGLFMGRWPNRSLAEELLQKTVFDAVRGRGSYDSSKGCPEDWIRSLESKEKAILEAKYIEELSAKDIARQMNTTEKAVYSLLYRAKISLRRELGRIASLSTKEENDETKR